MRSLAEARGRILAEARPGDPIEVALAEAVGLVLAEPLTADVDLPPFDRAAADGYAVRAADALCVRAGAPLSPDEWRRHVGDVPYQPPCPGP